ASRHLRPGCRDASYGSSAGATIQGSYLARGDTKNNQIMMGDHEVGFGFLKNVAIDQHVLARNRQFDLFTILKEKPELLGIGLDENTAIFVQGDEFEVLGASFVLMYDQGFHSREGYKLKKLPSKESLFYFLKEGEKYDLKKRKVIE
ncbi:MAG: Type 1 glutamine amidotransferase-like domain-containing protein, partial [Bacteroidota bacterium]